MKQVNGTATVAHELYAVIRERIVNGLYGQGMRLTEQQIAAEFNTSRTPVREALRQLTADGFLVFKPNSGTLVREWSTQQIHELFDLRVLIESEIALHAAEHIDDAGLSELTKVQDEIETRGADISEENTVRIGHLNRRFHALIAQASDSERLTSVLSNAIEQPIVQRTFRRYTVPQLERSFAHHRELLDAFRNRNGAWAKSIMTCHIHAAKFALLQDNPHADDNADTP